MQIPQVLDAIQLSHATFNKIRQNLWWAFGYNLVGVPLAAGALLPSMGIALTPSISGVTPCKLLREPNVVLVSVNSLCCEATAADVELALKVCHYLKWVPSRSA